VRARHAFVDGQRFRSVPIQRVQTRLRLSKLSTRFGKAVSAIQDRSMRYCSLFFRWSSYPTLNVYYARYTNSQRYPCGVSEILLDVDYMYSFCLRIAYKCESQKKKKSACSSFPRPRRSAFSRKVFSRSHKINGKCSSNPGE
jgi:hypothetical protein